MATVWHGRQWDCRTIADALLSVVLAPRCAACSAPLEHPMRGPVCGACWSSVVPLTPPFCDACGVPLPTWPNASRSPTRCPRCRRSPPVIACARAAGLYDGRLRDIIHAFKYEGRRSIARPLADLMRWQGSAVLEKADVVVAVPLHRSRRRERGFDQAYDLAVRLGLPVARALRRVRATPPQAALPASERRRNVRRAFAPRRPARRLRGAVVVIVDDVATTGATLEACARVLKAVGAREVRALTAARVATTRR